MATIILKPSEYQGAAGTAVAGRIVILSLQEVESRAQERAAAAPSRGKGGRGAKGKTDATSTAKLEMHISGTDSTAEVLYVEAWAEMATQLYAKFKQGDLITIAGGTVISAAQPYSTSKLLYYLRLKGTLGIQVQIAKVDTVPWTAPGLLHPLVPLRSLERVRDRQQICVAAVMVENPGSVERQTSNGMASVCNAIVQEGDIRVRCGFWREHAEKLAAVVQNTCIVLYQVLVSKRKQDQDSWELGSWRGTQIVSCPQDHADRLFPDMTLFRFLYVFLFFLRLLYFCSVSQVLSMVFCSSNLFLSLVSGSSAQVGCAARERELPHADRHSHQGLEKLSCRAGFLEWLVRSHRSWNGSKSRHGVRGGWLAGHGNQFRTKRNR